VHNILNLGKLNWRVLVLINVFIDDHRIGSWGLPNKKEWEGPCNSRTAISVNNRKERLDLISRVPYSRKMDVGLAY
jgi:hypothetical protein